MIYGKILEKYRKNIGNLYGQNPGTSFSRKKNPAGGRTTDMGFVYIKSKNPRSKIQKSKKIQNFKIKNPTSEIKNPS